MHSFPIVILGGGCFWSVEAVLQRVRGVLETIPGYVWATAGADAALVPMGPQLSGLPPEHLFRAQRIEVVSVRIDPDVLPLQLLLEIFMASHAASNIAWDHIHELSPNRSLVAFESAPPEVVAEARAYIEGCRRTSGLPIGPQTRVLESMQPAFMPAPLREQDFFQKHGSDPFSVSIIQPKIDRVCHRFRSHYLARPQAPVRHPG